jgi:hypothetical protein
MPMLPIITIITTIATHTAETDFPHDVTCIPVSSEARYGNLHHRGTKNTEHTKDFLFSLLCVLCAPLCLCGEISLRIAEA